MGAVPQQQQQQPFYQQDLYAQYSGPPLSAGWPVAQPLYTYGAQHHGEQVPQRQPSQSFMSSHLPPEVCAPPQPQPQQRRISGGQPVQRSTSNEHRERMQRLAQKRSRSRESTPAGGGGEYA